MAELDLRLLLKYDRPGPRYTSYPPAPLFHEKFGAAELRAHWDLEKSVNPRGISLYVHIPFCDTMCWFCGCNTQVSRDREKIRGYLDDLMREIDLVASYWEREVPVMQMHWGGGTPTHLSPEEIEWLGNYLRNKFRFLEDAEIGVEIDPRELTWEHIEALRRVGFNRCSLGVQDFSEKVQRAVNRVQPEEITRRAVEWIRSAGMRSLNMDLMYGLPLQDEDSFLETLRIARGMNPDRFALFSFAYLPDLKKHQRLIRPTELPVAERKLQLLKLAVDYLQGEGYEYIGMDHFAKPDDDLAQALRSGTLYRNFQGYSTHSGLILIGLGASAISMTGRSYAQNAREVDAYSRKVRAGEFPVWRGIELSSDDLLRREVIMSLMCRMYLNTRAVEERYSISFRDYFFHALEALEELRADGLVEISEEHIRVPHTGRFFIRNIAMCFDSYNGRNAAAYSRTI